MRRVLSLFVIANMFLPATTLAGDGLKPGMIPIGEHRRLAAEHSTREDVLELLGPPADEVDVKAAKLLKKIDAKNRSGIEPCLPAGASVYHLWKYQMANVSDGGFEYDSKRFGDPYVYIAFREDGRVCVAFSEVADF
ncbi:MAG: hypothetical protein IT507_11680 [Burkholderiaceae bacterium]|nr:hypothetical protein [Burkholderiaceae bacterium]